MLTGLVEQTILPEVWRNLVVTFVVLGIWSYLYKMHPFYGFLENITLGFMTAHGLLVAFDTINRGILIPLNTDPATNILLIVPLILGLLSYTFFSPNYITVYRIVNGFLLAIVLGIREGTTWMSNIASLLNYMRFSVTDLSYLVTLGTTFITAFYFLNLRKYEPQTRGLRKIATWGSAMAIGFMCGTLYIQRIAVLIGWYMDFTTYPQYAGWIPMIVVALLIAVDALVGWRKILGLQKPVAGVEV
ncbi:hypothetical protein AC480_00310 [miscellaneous Crenarchaeota group archaeon SMTZ1-55]|nr:MAG: hypothetical protein AC480_00310 [miscellaneous Crenarchaeota group archaeon SMTZ1-55]